MNSTAKRTMSNSASPESPRCPKCGTETEWWEFKAGHSMHRIANYCHDCWNEIALKQQAEDDERQARAEELNRKAKMDRILEQSRIGRRFADCTLVNFEAVKGTEVALRTCTRYTQEFSKDSGDGLILTGPSGSGKSHLAVAIVKAIAATGKTAIFQSVPELLARLRATYEKGGNEDAEEEIFDSLNSCDLLVLDDIGAEKQSVWTEEKLYLLIDRRYRDKRSTIVTTNLRPVDLETALGTRAMDRLLETCRIVPLSTGSWRRRPK